MAELLSDPAKDNPGTAAAAGELLGKSGSTPGQGDGKGTDAPVVREWMKGLPEPLKASKSLAKFTSPEEAFKAYTELEGKLGRSVEIPPADASPEEKAKFYDRVGRPKSPDEYAIIKGTMDDAFVKAYKAKAHAAGLTAAQADELFGLYKSDKETREKAAVEQYTERAKEADLILRKQYGSRYDANLKSAEKAFAGAFPEALRAQLKKDGYAVNPDFINVLVSLGEQLGEDSLILSAHDKEPRQAKTFYDRQNERFRPK